MTRGGGIHARYGASHSKFFAKKKRKKNEDNIFFFVRARIFCFFHVCYIKRERLCVGDPISTSCEAGRLWWRANSLLMKADNSVCLPPRRDIGEPDDEQCFVFFNIHRLEFYTVLVSSVAWWYWPSGKRMRSGIK